MKTALKQGVFSGCLCAVCGKERCLWRQPFQPPDLKMASRGLLFWSPLWERQQSLQACLLPCRRNTCHVTWEGWHIQGVLEPSLA